MAIQINGELPLPQAPRDRIVAAGLACVNRLGIRKTTMEDIAAQAGMSRPSVYRHFSDRDQLLIELISTQSHALVERAHTYIGRQPTFGDQLVEGLLYLAEHGCRDPLSRHVHLENPELGLRVASAGLVEDLTEAFWRPFVESAVSAGLLPENLDKQRVYEWLGYVGLMLMRLIDEDGSGGARYRSLLQQFVVPALLSGADVEQAAPFEAVAARHDEQ